MREPSIVQGILPRFLSLQPLQLASLLLPGTQISQSKAQTCMDVLGKTWSCTHWGNVRVILGLYWDNGKENGNYDNGYIG